MIKDSHFNRFSIMTNHIQANSVCGQSPISPTRTNRLRTALRRFAASAALMLGFAMPAVATDYVISYTSGNTTYYLGMNGNSLEAKQSFDPTCIWTCRNGSNDASLGSTSYSLRNKNNNSYYLTTSCTRGGNMWNRTYTWAALSVQTSANNIWRSSDGTNGNIYAYYSTTGLTAWNRSASINVSSLSMIDDNTNSSQNYKVTSTQNTLTDNTTAPTISSCSINNGQLNFTHTNLSGTYVPANSYTIYTFNSADHNWYNNQDWGTAVPTGVAKNVNTLSPTYTWNITGNASIDNNGVVTFNGTPSGNYTVTLTTSNISPIPNKTSDSYTFTVTQNDVADNTTAPTISVGSQNGNTFQMNHTNLGGNYTPAYTTYRYDNANHNWYDNSEYGNTAPAAVTPTPTYTWSVQSGNATITSDGQLTINDNATGNIVVRLTTSDISPLADKTADYTITVTKHNLADNTTAPAISVGSFSDNKINLNHTNLSGNYNPAYTTYRYNNANHNWYNGTDYNNNTPTVNSNTLNPTYTWSIQQGDATINASTGQLTLNQNITCNIVVRLTTSNISPLTDKTVDFTLTTASVAENVNTVTELGTPNITPASAIIEHTENQEFTASATASATTTTIPAHITLTGGGNTYYYYNNTLYNNTSSFTTVENTNPTITYSWSLTNHDGKLTPTTGTGASITVTHSTQATSVVNATLTVTASATGAASSKTATASIKAYPALTAPTITRNGTVVSISSTNTDATIYYTTDGNTPTASSDEYTTAFYLTTSPTTVKAIAIRNGKRSEVASQTYSLTVDKPEITIDQNSGSTTISCTTDDVVIYYTTDGTDPSSSSTRTSYNGAFTATSGQTIKAIATKTGFTNSEIASQMYVKSGVSGGVVTLNDLEDHNWTYYSGIDASVDGGNYNDNYQGKMYSPNPRNVKITYNGVNDVKNSTTTVKVSRTENDTSFVYYKTLEESSTSGEYKYQVISNPFSVRPSTGSGNSKVYYGFAGWKIVSGGEYIKNHNNDDVLGLDEEIVFNNLPYPSVNCTSAEIVFETTWTQANVQTGSSISTMLGKFSGGTYETNFAVLTGNYTTAWTGNKNATITSVLPDGSTDYRGVYTRLNVTVSSGYTIKYEYININNDNSTLSMGTGTKTLYIGRGVSNTTANGVVCNLIQGYNDAINSGGLTYTLKIESGIYNYLSFIKGYDGAQTNDRVSGTVSVKGVLGCDYDRAKGDNSKLKIQNQIMMGYANSGRVLLRNATAGTEVLNVTLKSGSLHSSRSDAGTADADQSFYIGIAGEYSAGYRIFTMEGGEMWSLAAGLCQNTATTNSVRFRIKGGLIKGSIYGSAANANSYGYKQMIITGGQIKGWIAGGGNGTSANGGTTTGSSYIYVGGNARVDSEGSNTKINSSLGGQVFGSGSGVENTTTWGEMLYGSNVVIADNAYIERNVFGGGNFGWTDQYATIYLTGDKMSVGNVYGGANQNKGDNVRIYMTGGTVREGLYGGSNTTGTINYNVEMHINGGQVGTSSSPANIHGGGYGSPTRVSQNVEITLGTSGQTTDGVTVYGDVYGGSALGYVNGTSGTNSYHTYVTLNKGIINGSLYGGALGQKNGVNGATSNIEANVYGPVQVKVYGGSVRKTDANGANGSGGIYGANNINGAPQRSVTVDIYGTDPAPSANEYALFAVYGGGNAADYTYTPANNDPYPKVTVHNCDNSIEYVYGGGNAARVAATDVKIYGGYIIGNVFGGGNGKVTAANVTNNTNVNIYGGTIRSVYGGSNSQGEIGGDINVSVAKDSDCPIKVGALYGGGNEAPSDIGNISIGCMDANDMIDSLFCGANRADITGSVNFTMTGGRIDNLFGGNNNDGNVSGSITVTVNWITSGNNACLNNHLGNVFGGGNLATFGTAGSPKAPTVNIYNGTVSGNVYGGGKGKADDHEKGQIIGNPQVTIGDNVDGHQATISGSVFGGGDAGNVVGTPVVNVIDKCNTIISTGVYGGGNAADVDSTHVTIEGGTIGDVFGGGNGQVAAANVTKGTNVTIHGGTITRVFAGSNTSGTIGNATSVTIDHSSSCNQSISEVYGGGNLANGKAGTITIECSAENIGDVYGGANQADIGTSENPSNITLNINGGQIDNVFGGNNTSGDIYGTITVNINKATDCNTFYVNNVYGGGNQAQYTSPNDGEGHPTYPRVNILNGTVSQNVYGGGKGDPNDHTKGQVTGNPVVTIGDATRLNNNNIVAAVTGDVYGGGDAGNVVGTPQVNVINKCNTTIGNVYGGGNAADVSGTDVKINGGNITGMVFGGGHGDKNANPQKAANVNGNVAVDITGGTINKVFGGSNSMGNITGTVAVNIAKVASSCEMHITEVYGGGNQAAGNAGTITIGCTGDYDNNNEGIGDVYGGANAADINSNITLNITGGSIQRVFGGNNSSGGVKGSIEVNVNWDPSKNCDNNYLGSVYGGGNQAAYSIYGYAANGAYNTTNPSENTPYDNPVVNILNGTVSGNVFGGGLGATAVVVGNPVVTIGDANNLNVNTVQAVVTGDVYGGGDAGNVVGTPQVNVINKCNTTIGNVYGGGNAADVSGTDVNIDGGTISGMVFGGGHGDKNSNPQKSANVNGNVAVDITGGTINKVFGGSNSKGNITGTVAVNIEKGATSCDMHITEVYGGGNEAAGNAGTLTIGCTGDYTNNNEGIGDVYGGANAADINNDISLTINGGHINNVYGGNNSSGSISGTIAVEVNWDNDLTCDKYLGNVFGGGNLAAYTGSPTVTLTNGTVSHNVYGGGNEAGVGGSTVYINGGQVLDGVYGGCNTSGNVGGAIAVYLNGGIIGTSGITPTPDIAFGGGYGASTSTSGNVSLTINGSTIHGNVYGGSALGNVNGSSNTTAVKLTSGTVNGSLYGGGLGNNANPAAVNGNVTVQVDGGTIRDYVFGCNNVNGAPQGTVTVTINSTGSGSISKVFGGGNQAAYTGTPSVVINNGTVGNVFGGGLGSSAVVTGGTSVTIGTTTSGKVVTITGDVYGGGDEAAVTGTTSVLVVSNCNNTINGDVYGGGNAANVGATDVDINGGVIEGRVFGGGHGDKNSNPQKEANVGGNVAVDITGGTINKVFGGSNSKGTISGTVAVNIAKGNNSCDMFIGEVYGGGNEAAGNAGTVTIGCTGEWTIDDDDDDDDNNFHNKHNSTDNRIGYDLEGIGAVYGGANAADIGSSQRASNITLNINSGMVDKVYGGNNTSGDIYGTIEVNINKNAQTCGWYVGDVFGGGNQAVYTAPTGSEDYPQVNILNGTVSGDVFGGGYGKEGDPTKGVVNGNPQVTINGANASVAGGVFGGGSLAPTVGDPVVTQTNGSTTNIYGGGKQAVVDGNTTVNIEGGSVSTDVYGGGMQGDVTGDVTVNISKSGTSGTPVIGRDVYGGGALANTNTANNVANPPTPLKVTVVNLYPGATINHDVYGGGRGQKADQANNINSVEAIVYGDVTVNQMGSILIAHYSNEGLATSGRIFGGNNINGTPKGHILVYVTQTTGTTGQTRAQDVSGTTVTTENYELAAVYGGGNEAEYNPSDNNDYAEVRIEGCDAVSIHSVYGGGNAASVPATKVTIGGAYEIGYVFGGGNGAGTGNPGANVGYHAYSEHTSSSDEDKAWRQEYKLYGTGVATTEVYGGRIHYIYGGSNTKGNVREIAVAMLDEVSTCPLVVDGIYGGGREAYMEGSSMLEMGCVTGLNEIYGGSEKADVGSNVELTITSGHFNKVFGGNNKGGRILGSIKVNIEQTGCVPITIDELYLGGNNAPYSVYGYKNDTIHVDLNDEKVVHYIPNKPSDNNRIYDEPVLNIRSFKSIGNVYGGGNGKYAVMVANPIVDINVTQGWVNGEYVGEKAEYSDYKRTPALLQNDGVIDTVFGGGNAARVEGSPTVKIGDRINTKVLLKSMDDLYTTVGASGERRSDVLIQRDTKDNADAIKYTIVGDNNVPVSGKDPLTVNLSQTVKGATISGNVYGGGNAADVTGGTNIQVGPNGNGQSGNGGGNGAPTRSSQTTTQVSAQSEAQQPAAQQQPAQSNAATESNQSRSVNANRAD